MCLNLDYIKVSSDKVVSFVPETLNTIRLDHHLPPMELNTFQDIKISVVAHLLQYIKMIAAFRNTGTNQLLLSFVSHISQSQAQLSLKVVCNSS